MQYDKGEYNDQFFFPVIDTKLPFTISLAGQTRPMPNFRVPVNHPLNPALSCYQLEYVTEGKGYIDIGGKTYEAQKGDFFLIGRSIPRTLYCGASDPWEKLFITVSGDFMQSLLDLYHINSTIIVLKADVYEYFENIMNILHEAESYTIIECNKICVEILKIIQTVSMLIHREEKYIDNNLVAEKILNYINANLTRKITTEDLCNQFYMGRTHLTKIFKEKYNMTPMKYVQGQRLVMAKDYLRTTNISISELSDMLCFADSKYFSNVFKSYVGISPKEYQIHYRGYGGKDEIAFHHDDFVKLVPQKKNK